jgi:hypothetical protein
VSPARNPVDGLTPSPSVVKASDKTSRGTSGLAYQTPGGRKIVTDYWMKPIPDRRFDWSAVTEDYCGCGECHCPQGSGRTEAEAIADLLEEIEMRDETA